MKRGENEMKRGENELQFFVYLCFWDSENLSSIFVVNRMLFASYLFLGAIVKHYNGFTQTRKLLSLQRPLTLKTGSLGLLLETLYSTRPEKNYQ